MQGFSNTTRRRGRDKEIEPEDMGLPLTNASRLPEDNLPFNSDSKESFHPQLAKIKTRLPEPVALRTPSRKAKAPPSRSPMALVAKDAGLLPALWNRFAHGWHHAALVNAATGAQPPDCPAVNWLFTILCRPHDPHSEIVGQAQGQDAVFDGGFHLSVSPPSSMAAIKTSIIHSSYSSSRS